MFTLAVSCLTTFNLPRFMNLTFQVPKQYCFLQHHTLLLLPVTSTTGCCFPFGFISPLFLLLFLHSSLVAYWAPTNLGSSSFSVIQKTKIMASIPITSWQIDGETVADFILRGFKITKNHGDCSHEI